MFNTCEIDLIKCFHRSIMLKRKQRIRPAEDAKSHILSSRDKTWFKESFIDVNKGTGISGPFTGQYLAQLHFSVRFIDLCM